MAEPRNRHNPLGRVDQSVVFEEEAAGIVPPVNSRATANIPAAGRGFGYWGARP
jgi:hypothetical protein